MNSKKIKIYLIIIISFIVICIGIGALQKAIDAITIEKRIFEITGFYISVFSLHFLNSILKDYIREYRKKII